MNEQATGLPRVTNPCTKKSPPQNTGVGQTRSRAGERAHTLTLKKKVAFTF